MPATAPSPVVRPARADETDAVLRVERAAFGGDVEAALVTDLLEDPTALPVTSLVAEVDGETVGHVLFTGASPGEGNIATAVLLAPLAVHPSHQRQGIGTALVRGGLERLTADGIDCVLVLGDPAYYGRFGFVPAARYRIRPPYPLPSEHADAWMALRLSQRPLPPGSPPRPAGA